MYVIIFDFSLKIHFVLLNTCIHKYNDEMKMPSQVFLKHIEIIRFANDYLSQIVFEDTSL